MLDNYQQALAIIDEYSPQVDSYCKKNNILESDFDTWHAEELAYLKNVSAKVPVNPELVDYVKALEALDGARARYDQCGTIEFRVYTEADFLTASGGLSNEVTVAARTQEAERARQHSNLIKAMLKVHELEVSLQITRRWKRSDVQYQDALKFVNHNSFVAVVDELEGRIVQRLFELAKANLAGTGNIFILFNYLKDSNCCS